MDHFKETPPEVGRFGKPVTWQGERAGEYLILQAADLLGQKVTKFE
jgi:hypothetical protein